MKRIALIDADVLCYKAAAVATKEIDWDGDGEKTPIHSEATAHAAAFTLVKSWTKQAGCSRARLLFSDRSAPKTSFRYNVHPHYKEQRATAKKPHLLKDVERWAMDRFDGMAYSGLEGDDALGIEATQSPGRYVIISSDKDMRTIPGKVMIVPHMKPISIAKVETITPFMADYNWMFQTIVGDVVDNYKGAPGAGAVAARRWLNGAKTLEEMWRDVLGVYQKQWQNPRWRGNFIQKNEFVMAWDGLSKFHPAWCEALMNARCARILRAEDYDNGRIRLWSPDGDHEWIAPF